MTLMNDRFLYEHGADLVEPFDPKHVQPASIDVHLGPYLKFEWSSAGPAYISAGTDSADAFYAVRMSEENPKIQIMPGDLVLGSTFEKIRVPNGYAARFEGKSSLGRDGLLTHLSAGFIDPGFAGHITVEMTKVGRKPFLLEAGMKIGQVCFFKMSGTSKNPYGSAAAGSHYQGQTVPQVSRSHERYAPINVWGN